MDVLPDSARFCPKRMVMVTSGLKQDAVQTYERERQIQKRKKRERPTAAACLSSSSFGGCLPVSLSLFLLFPSSGRQAGRQALGLGQPGSRTPRWL